jgi:hypothetical protein
MSYVQFASTIAVQLKKADTFTPLFAQMYEKLGSIAELFLIGDPQDPLYLSGSVGNMTGVLADVIHYY